MPQLILQPAGGEAAREHFQSTILNKISVDDIFQFLGHMDQKLLSQIYKNQKCLIWGVTPGSNNANVSKWNRINEGDIALFCRDKFLFAKAVVTHKTHNANLAEYLWGSDANIQTWEYIYFLQNLEDISVSYRQFNQSVGYKSNYVPQGFNVLNEQAGDAFFVDHYSLEQQINFGRTITSIPQILDRPSAGFVRTEQTVLRQTLLQGKEEGICSICQKNFPKSLLRAAHIKPRHVCTSKEMQDIPNIGMLACVMGCDSLYEEGLVSVHEGEVQAHMNNIKHVAVKEYVNKIAGYKCPIWGTNNAAYFKWHHRNIAKTA
tara:strand:- start:26 stop:979 length:954 start_codon:yes stop_codon:yes gene_type:complete